MPKQKTHRGAAKRFKVTKSGQIKRFKQNKSHMLNGKERKRKRDLRHATYIDHAQSKTIREMIYSK